MRIREHLAADYVPGLLHVAPALEVEQQSSPEQAAGGRTLPGVTP